MDGDEGAPWPDWLVTLRKASSMTSQVVHWCSSTHLKFLPYSWSTACAFHSCHVGTRWHDIIGVHVA